MFLVMVYKPGELHSMHVLKRRKSNYWTSITHKHWILFIVLSFPCMTFVSTWAFLWHAALHCHRWNTLILRIYICSNSFWHRYAFQCNGEIIRSRIGKELSFSEQATFLSKVGVCGKEYTSSNIVVVGGVHVKQIPSFVVRQLLSATLSSSFCSPLKM